MIKLTIENNLKGEVKIPPSKSIAHRALILASLAKEEVVISNIAYSNDILATISCLESLGTTIIKEEGKVIIRPGVIHKVKDLNCGESGTTLRFMIPYVLLQSEEIKIDGENRLKVRPIADYFPMLEANQVKYIYDGSLPLTLEGNLKCGKYELNGNVSSQFISGLLLVLPFLNGDSEVIIKNKLESKPYVDLTLKVAKEFGIEIIVKDNIYYIKGNQKVNINRYEVEGDYSQAAFFLVANALGAELKLSGLRRSGMQGDEDIIKILEDLGVTFDENFMAKKREYKSGVISLAQNPDLAPILGVFASYIPGCTKLIDLERLVYKESNRLLSTLEILTNCNVSARIVDNTLEINGRANYRPGKIKSYNDHRIVMASAIMALLTKEIYIDEIKPVNKSFPNFFNIYKQIGGKVYE